MALHLCFDLKARPVALVMHDSSNGVPAPPSLGPSVAEVMAAVAEHRWAAGSADFAIAKEVFTKHDSTPSTFMVPAGQDDPGSGGLCALIGALENALRDVPPLAGWRSYDDGTPGPARLTAALVRCAILHATLAPTVYDRVIATTREGVHYSTARVLYDHCGRKWTRYQYRCGHDELIAGPLVWPREAREAAVAP
ncbi:hypothetical protein [Gordonia sp. OPL2]|uniref:hypothetical protein n=1 Tax=Gordonia sp. OPL2 TaxID=2486274 RepID=UPI0016559553|nr:hypothetical protein [Gordonia sp. OPL2]